MITIFNRKKLLTDTSAEEIRRVTELLKQHHIPYEIVTKRSQSPAEMSFHANIGSKLGNGDAKTASYCMGEITFIYHVYVRKSDYEKASGIV